MKHDGDALAALAALYEQEGYGPPPDEPITSEITPGFRPSLNPIQGEAYDAIRTHLYNLLTGERYSGKTQGGLHALVEHCVNNPNALALIIVLTGRQGEEGGCWAKLHTFIKHEWEKAHVIITEPKTNKYKDVFCWISNRFGGYSRVVLLSMPFEGFVADRIKGMEPTFILVDEAQTLQSDTYFTSIIQQLGRVQHVKHQPIVYCCNPAGPSHWLYQRFFVDPYDAETGDANPDYYVRHVPVSDNPYVPPAYLRRLKEATKNDDIEYRRMVLGEWIDKPEGEALFKQSFDADRHVKGDTLRNQGILPHRNAPIITGWDLGAAHSSIHLQQFVATDEHVLWVVFDELVYVDTYMPYRVLVPKVIRRMQYWCDRMRHLFTFTHISDNSAFNQFRAKEGSFDALDVEQLSREYCFPPSGSPGLLIPGWITEGMNPAQAAIAETDYRQRFVLKLVPAPKAPYSVEHRVRATTERLLGNELLVSATCHKTIEMFNKLEEDKKERMKPRRSRFLHPFDSMTYPHHYYNSKQKPPDLGMPVEPEEEPGFYALS